MKENPLVSVIISLYNETVDMVSQAINSIRTQTYENLEILLLLDCVENSAVKEYMLKVEKEDRTVVGIEELTVLVQGLDVEINSINTMMKELQIDIGSLLQKAEQIEDLEDEIAILQRKQVEVAKETADYDILKGAFSQDGIPHQIIRSIMPKLTTTANAGILTSFT